jgi:hypothetical protein
MVRSAAAAESEGGVSAGQVGDVALVILRPTHPDLSRVVAGTEVRQIADC